MKTIISKNSKHSKHRERLVATKFILIINIERDSLVDWEK